MGYRETDFLPFGTSLRERRPRFEAGLTTLRRALRGELVDGIHVAPHPVRPGGPELWIGALSRPAVERAARLADGIVCVVPDQIGAYVDARRALGHDDGQVALGYQWVIADDPERAFAAVAPHILYQVNAYAEFGYPNVDASRPVASWASEAARRTWCGPAGTWMARESPAAARP